MGGGGGSIFFGGVGGSVIFCLKIPSVKFAYSVLSSQRIFHGGGDPVGGGVGTPHAQVCALKLITHGLPLQLKQAMDY